MNKKEEPSPGPNQQGNSTNPSEMGLYKKSGHSSLCTVCRIQTKGHKGGKIYLAGEILKPQLENGVTHFRIVASELGGRIILIPIRDAELAHELEEV